MGRRCLWAISGLLVAVALVVGCVVGILKGRLGCEGSATDRRDDDDDYTHRMDSEMS